MTLADFTYSQYVLYFSCSKDILDYFATHTVEFERTLRKLIIKSKEGTKLDVYGLIVNCIPTYIFKCRYQYFYMARTIWNGVRVDSNFVNSLQKCSRCPAISNYIYNILHVAWCEVYINIHVNNINIILDTIKIWFVNLLIFVLKCCLKMNGTVHSKYNIFLSFKLGLLIICGLVRYDNTILSFRKS